MRPKVYRIYEAYNMQIIETLKQCICSFKGRYRIDFRIPNMQSYIYN